MKWFGSYCIPIQSGFHADLLVWKGMTNINSIIVQQHYFGNDITEGRKGVWVSQKMRQKIKE